MKIIDNNIPSRLVKNLTTGEFVEFSIKLTPKEALTSAYAYLSLKDPDSPQHKDKYEGKIKDSGKSFILGDWEVLKIKENIEENQSASSSNSLKFA